MPAPRLILASRSPRRAKLLRDAGFVFEQVDPPFADPPAPSQADSGGAQSPSVVATELAKGKAMSVVSGERLGRDNHAVVVASDTIVVGRGGEMLGQPGDTDDARAMLESLVGATHEVVTGVVLLASSPLHLAAFADTARVSLGNVPTHVLDAYLAGGGWNGKAGGYNLAELEDDWPFTVEGDRTTVIGLPMRRLVPALREFGIVPAGAPSARHTSGADAR